MKGRLLLAVAVTAWSISLLSGCGKMTGPESEAAQAVENYVNVCQAVYINRNMDLLAPVATQKEMTKIFPVILALKTTDNVMKTEIEEFKIKKVNITSNPDRGTVETTERWEYWWEDRKTGQVTKPKNVEKYRLEYNLVKEQGRWKVDFIKNLN